MNRTKVRFCLLSLVILALMAGAVYYFYFAQNNSKTMEGTLVKNMEQVCGRLI